MPRHLTHLLPTTQKIDGSDRGAGAAVNDIKLKMNKNYTTRQFRGWRVLAKIHAWGRIYDFDAVAFKGSLSPSRYQSGHADIGQRL